jgi:hypothetical protein
VVSVGTIGASVERARVQPTLGGSVALHVTGAGEADDGPEPRAATGGRALNTALVYFGHADDPEPPRARGRSRYGDVSPALDADVDALRARIAELERRLRPEGRRREP